jgi:hypothetical protein
MSTGNVMGGGNQEKQKPPMKFSEYFHEALNSGKHTIRFIDAKKSSPQQIVAFMQDPGVGWFFQNCVKVWELYEAFLDENTNKDEENNVKRYMLIDFIRLTKAGEVPQSLFFNVFMWSIVFLLPELRIIIDGLIEKIESAIQDGKIHRFNLTGLLKSLVEGMTNYPSRNGTNFDDLSKVEQNWYKQLTSRTKKQVASVLNKGNAKKKK